MLFVLLHNEMFSNQRPVLALHCSHSLINQLGGMNYRTYYGNQVAETDLTPHLPLYYRPLAKLA